MKRFSYVLSILIALSALPAQAATLTATKTVAGGQASGAQVTYTIVISNSGTAQADNPGDEFIDTLPSPFSTATASATSGTTSVTGGFPPTVRWNGAVAAGGSVTITITATLGFVNVGTAVSNQGTVNFDSDGDGTNESTVQTDDPSLPGAADPTVFSVERKGAGAARPSATLLLPYFEVDPVPNFPAAASNPGAPLNTVLTVGNADASAVLARVTVWTDYGIPTLSFHLYLTGYDMETIDLRQLFDGVLPRSADAGEDPFDNISNKGPLSQDINYPCNSIHNATRLPAADITGLRRAHSGLSSSLFGNQCASRNHTDGILRGYVTIDLVTSCNDALLPNDAGYEALLDNRNYVWGSYSITNAPNNYSDSGNLVHVQAKAAGALPFYRRFNNDTTREALGSVWGARYLNGGAFDAGTILRVWREPRTKPVPVACATTAPAFLPGRQVQIVAFDEQENPVVPGVGAQFAQPFPLVTQQVRTNSPSLPLTSPFGWLYLDLNHGPPAAVAQSYVSVAHSASGRFRVSNGATMFQSGLAQALPTGASLRATKAVAGNFNAGGTVTYTVAISNEGNATQQNNAGAEFTDVLPAQLTLVSATATSGTATATVATNTVTWNGGLGIGASTTVTITATVKSPLPVGTVVSNQGQLMCDGNADGTNESCGNTDDPITFPSFGPGAPDPTIFLVGGGNRVAMSGTKTVAGAPFLAGGNVVYTVVLRNNGPGTLLNDAGNDEFTDSVPGSLIFQSVTATSGTAANPGGNQVTWNGTLAPNATVTLTIRAQINPIIPTGTFIANQGSMRYDANGDGTLDATRRTDNPATPDVNDTTGFTVGP